MSPEDLMRDSDTVLVEMHVENVFAIHDTASQRTPLEQTKLLGAVAGNKIAGKGDRGTGTAIGAVVGAGAGSAVGCGMQKNEAAKQVGGVYKSGGYRYAQTVQAAPLVKMDKKYVTRSTVNLRADASTYGQRLGSVQSGTTFQALGRTGDGKWILVGQDGVGVGYVSSAYVYRA